jgi:hypothetical protein
MFKPVLEFSKFFPNLKTGYDKLEAQTYFCNGNGKHVSPVNNSNQNFLKKRLFEYFSLHDMLCFDL